jgi:nucleotide-binding universal stress UspA family protein
MVKILVASDGSASARQAVRLTAGLAWEPGTEVRVTAVAAWDGPGKGEMDRQLRQAAELLSAPGREVTTAVLQGRPASTLIEEARRLEVDLLVVGSRGRGRLESILLGSVSGETVERAPCSVLISRGESAERLLVAVDDSAAGREVPRFLCRSGAFAGREALVLSVSQDPRPWAPNVDPVAARAATRAASHLQGCGLEATREVRVGDPAATIVETAVERSSDLLVVGSRGMSGLRRILLGSVARNTVLYAPSSVLVVRRRRQLRKTDE